MTRYLVAVLKRFLSRRVFTCSLIPVIRDSFLGETRQNTDLHKLI